MNIEKKIAITQAKIAALKVDEKMLKKLLDHQAELDTKKANKAFNGLSAAEKRVAIAQDVLLQIKNKFIKVEPGTWVSLDFKDEELLTPNESAQKTLSNNTEQCQACALGSLFICSIRLGNRLTVEEAGFKYGVGDQEDIMERLSLGIFSKEQLKLIEVAFEGGLGGYAVGDLEDKDAGEAAMLFSERLLGDKARLVKIMKNIIKNDGTFIP